MVEGQAASRSIEVARELGTEIVEAFAEETSPIAIGTVDFFEGRLGFRFYSEFPDDNIVASVVVHAVVPG
jgi:hypothetical protein